MAYQFQNAHLKVFLRSPNVYQMTLNNPAQKNALSMDIVRGLETALMELELVEDCRVVLIIGEGDAFSAGGDVKAMSEQSGMFAGDPFTLKENYHRGIQRIPRAMENFSKPIIAVLNGAAVGAGADLSLMCDLRIGYNKSSFLESFQHLGLIPGDGGAFFLQRVVGYSKAMEMFLLSEKISGERAYDFGLLNRFVNSDRIEDLWAEVDLATNLLLKGHLWHKNLPKDP